MFRRLTRIQFRRASRSIRSAGPTEGSQKIASGPASPTWLENYLSDEGLVTASPALCRAEYSIGILHDYSYARDVRILGTCLYNKQFSRSSREW